LRSIKARTEPGGGQAERERERDEALAERLLA